MKKIIYTRPEGGLSVVHPAMHLDVRSPVSEDEALKIALDKLPKGAINPQVIDESLIPADRTFRNAWRAGAGCVEHDMDKCRALHRDRLRALRKPLIEALDVEYMRADESGDAAAKLAIAAKKKALRDVTADPAIEAATTPEELKAVLPEVLRR